MENKRLVVVRIFAIIFLFWAIFSTYSLFRNQPWKIAKETQWKVTFILSGFLQILIPLLISFGLYNLKKWSRNLALFYGTFSFTIGLTTDFLDKLTRILKIGNLSFISSIQWIVLVLLFLWANILPFLLLFLLWWFFTQPKVKEQFK